MTPALLLSALLGIIGGEPSSDEAVVCLTADGFPLCTGSVIGAHTVLTAGHCVNPLGTGVTYWVNFGPDCEAPSRRVKVAEMRAHPDFTGEGRPFDLGVARTEAELRVTPLALSPQAVDASLVGLTLRHVGYGTSQESPMTGRGLQRAVRHAVTSVDADFVWSGDASANTCNGDSGGPFLLEGAVLATVSDGPDCHGPSADQRVDRGRAWLEGTLHEFEPQQSASPAQGCTSTGAVTTWGALLVWLDSTRRPWRAPRSSSGGVTRSGRERVGRRVLSVVHGAREDGREER